MAVTEVLEALGSFEFELKGEVPREILDAVDYFGHVAIVPGRMNPVEYGDNTLSAARYVGVIRRKKLADDGRSNAIMDTTRIGGVGMNFWLGDEDSKGYVIETPVSFTAASFNTVVAGLRPASLTAGTVYSVPGTYTGRHVYETPRAALQYVCDTMSSGGTAVYDTFNRSNSTTTLGSCDSGQAWVADAGTWGISSNQAYISAAADSMATISVAASFEAQLTVETISSGTAYMIFRASDSANHWRFGSATATGAIVLDKVVGGVVTNIATLSINMANSTTLKVIASGNDLYLYVNGVLYSQINDSYLASATKIGMKCNQTSTRFETYNVSPERSAVSFRVNNNGTLDAGPESSLYVTTPTCVIVRKGVTFGEDLTLRALPATLDLASDMEDFATRALLLAEANGESFATGAADISVVSPSTNSYKDLQGNALKLTRMVSESDTLDQNADVRAELTLRKTLSQRRALTLSTEDYDIFGSFNIGDYVYLYDPDAGLYDVRNEVQIRGARLNPLKLQVTETDWPLTDDYTVGFRAGNGTWYDLTDYVSFDDTTSSKVVIGDFQRQLTDSGQTLSSRIGSMTQSDNTTPAAPSWDTDNFQSVAYIDSNGNVKSHQKLAWFTPLNTDGSGVLDGDRYEIQFRINTGHLYSQTWTDVAALQWQQMNTWDTPVDLDAGQWETRFVQWGDNSFIISDLAEDTNYDFRIRAIDSGNNTSNWSSVATNQTARDNIPPSTPAAPTVAGSLIAIQVTHSMGKATGGTFNLENDLAFFEVHAQYEPNYECTLETKLGNLRATKALMAAETPTVGTFAVDQTVPVYVKVVAVDTSGNRSSPSIPTTVTAELISDQYISNLSVTKVTAGSIIADWILSGSIKTGTTGARMEMDSAGLRAYDSDGSITLDIESATGSITMKGEASSQNFVEGETGWHIAADGGTQFENLSVLNQVSANAGYFDTVFMNGVAVPSATDLANFYQLATPALKLHRTSAFNTASTYTLVNWEYNEFSLNSNDNMWTSSDASKLIAPVDGMYTISFSMQWASIATLHSTYTTIRKNSGGDPAGGTRIHEDCDAAGADSVTTNRAIFSCYLSAGEYVEMFCKSPSGAVALVPSSTGTAYIEMSYKAAILSGVVADAPPAANIQSYTANATWTRSFAGDNDERDAESGVRMYQGRFSSDYGQQKSQAGFNYPAIQAVLLGKTITGCTLRFKVQHSYNDYLTAIIGTHNNASEPSTWPGTGVTSDRVEKAAAYQGSTYTVDLGTTIGEEFRDDSAKGICFGPAPGSSTDLVYYGYMYGWPDDSDTAPMLTFYFTD